MIKNLIILLLSAIDGVFSLYLINYKNMVELNLLLRYVLDNNGDVKFMVWKLGLTIILLPVLWMLNKFLKETTNSYYKQLNLIIYSYSIIIVWQILNIIALNFI